MNKEINEMLENLYRTAVQDTIEYMDTYLKEQKLQLLKEVEESVMGAIEKKVKPLLDIDITDGGYECCGCSSYSQIYEDCRTQIIKSIETIRGENG